MAKVEFYLSWADTVAQARKQHGPLGAAVAHLMRAEHSGSKRLIAARIEAAIAELPPEHPAQGGSVQDVLDCYQQPWTAEGLTAAARQFREVLESQLMGQE